MESFAFSDLVAFEDFLQFTPELAERCTSDVDVTAMLWLRLQPKVNAAPSAVDLEMRLE